MSAEDRQKISSLARWTSATLRSTTTSTKSFLKSEATERSRTSLANTEAVREHKCKLLLKHGNIVFTKISCETKGDPCWEQISAQPHSFELALKCQTSHNLVSENAAHTQLQLEALGAENAKHQSVIIKHSNLSLHAAWIAAILRLSADNCQMKHRKALL